MAMAVMDDYLDSPMEGEDVFPCKGCGDILEEGKAFELAGNRWHLNCFRCNTCGTLLDSDANLLLLGDGSLICNNCTYSCSACGNKIEDLAILTGDQAFCATCFRCRNCKRKIENLRYARTSQGIFCMSCHESLMARRRKKSKAAAQAKAREKDASPMITDKSLPALPPNAIPPNAFSNDRVDPESDTPTELSPRPPRPAYSRNDSSSRSSSRPARSPERPAGEPASRDGSLSLPGSDYRKNRNSSIIPGNMDLSTLEGESFLIPVALDPSPAASMTPRSEALDGSKKTGDRDYFSIKKQAPTQERRSESQGSTPHIAFQEKGRQPSSDYENIKPPTRKLSKSSRTDRINQSNKPSPLNGDEGAVRESTSRASAGNDEFKLQEAPKSKKTHNAKNKSQSNITTDVGISKGSSNASRSSKGGPPSQPESPPRLSTGDRGTPRSSQDSRSKDDGALGSSSAESLGGRPDNNAKGGVRKEQTTGPSRNGALPFHPSPANASANQSAAGNGKVVQGPLLKAPGSDEVPPSNSPSGRPALTGQVSDTYMQPRAPPVPPPGSSHAPGKESTGGANGQSSPDKVSPKLPRWSAGGDFSMDEDMARILGTDEGSTSILRRVSNAVRHGRTASEISNSQGHHGHSRSVSETTSPRWPKTPLIEGHGHHHHHHRHSRDISSPISFASADDPALLKRQLRNSEQRVAELERQFNTEKDLKDLNKRLVEKRKTVSVLDTQTEVMIRQLEVLAGYVERAKQTKQPIDARELEDSAVKEFVQKLDKVKQAMAASIEQLHAERDELVEDKNRAVADRDRALLEFEQLSSKNAQLADMNNDLTHQIQERFKAQIGTDIKSPNGLGIYQQHKGPSHSSVALDATSLNTNATTLVNAAAADPDDPVVEVGPTVVNIRKGQVRKFNWKKGSKTMAQNVAKGVKGAVGAFQQERERGPHGGLTGENIGLPYNMTVAQVESPVSQHTPNGGQNRQQQNDNSRQGFGFFSSKKAGPMPKSMSTTNVSTPTIAEAPSTLFGSELADRAEYERRQIPSVVTRCIEEVELRGMDQEGIYRKTGGNSQVKMIQEGFEKSEDYDISDPSLDITAVTSVLKQYFRKLPTPLLTYEVYEHVLESNAITPDADRCTHLQKTVSMLPQKHRDCLEFLMFHLARVASRERENLMSPKNLAVVFAPTIMRDHNIEKEMTDMHAKNLAVQFIIEQSHLIFSEA